MSAQVYSVPCQTEGRRKVEPLICAGNINYYECAHHLILTRGSKGHPGNFQNKSVSSLFNWVSRYILC